MKKLEPFDILGWIPSRWDQFIGNKRLKKLLRRLLQELRRQIETGEEVDMSRLRLLVSGLSRTGKTAMMEFFVRCLVCSMLDPATLDPCRRECGFCRADIAQGSLLDLEHWVLGQSAWHNAACFPQFLSIDCTNIYTPAELDAELQKTQGCGGSSDLVIVYFDEVHRLAYRGMDQKLLKFIEQHHFFFILSTAKPSALEGMLHNRLVKVRTELPETEEMEDWICDRCQEWNIRSEPEAVVRLVDKSNRTVGIALHALALASVDPKQGLTLELVEEWQPEVEEE